MGFKFAFNDYGAPTHRVSHILATNGEAFVQDQAVSIVNGRLTKTLNGVAVFGFANQKLAAGTDQPLEVVLAREGDYFDAPYTGTPVGGFVVGLGAADISTDGLSVLSSDVTGGPFFIHSLNTNTKTVRVKVKLRQHS